MGAHVRSPLAGGVHSEVVGLTSLVDSRLDDGPDDIVFRLARQKYKSVQQLLDVVTLADLGMSTKARATFVLERKSEVRKSSCRASLLGVDVARRISWKQNRRFSY